MSFDGVLPFGCSGTSRERVRSCSSRSLLSSTSAILYVTRMSAFSTRWRNPASSRVKNLHSCPAFLAVMNILVDVMNILVDTISGNQTSTLLTPRCGTKFLEDFSSDLRTEATQRNATQCEATQCEATQCGAMQGEARQGEPGPGLSLGCASKGQRAQCKGQKKTKKAKGQKGKRAKAKQSTILPSRVKRPFLLGIGVEPSFLGPARDVVLSTSPRQANTEDQRLTHPPLAWHAAQVDFQDLSQAHRANNHAWAASGARP